MEFPRLKYKKMAGFATTYGQQYEVHLAALLFLRGLNSELDFQLGTNVQGAGALDDVVFRYKPIGDKNTWTTLYIQLKHKTRRPISRKLLTNPTGDFSLPTYFKSYLEIEQAMTATDRDILFDGSFEKCVFVIFTNAVGNHVIGMDRTGALDNVEEILWAGTGSVLSFEEDEDIFQSLGECGDKGNEFLRRLRVFCGQPNAYLLKTAVENELRKVDKEILNGLDLLSVLDCFLGNVKNWCEKSNELLHKENDLLRASILEVASRQIRKEVTLDVRFEDAVLKPVRDALEGGYRVLIVNSSERFCRLTYSKLLQTIKGLEFVLNTGSLLANRSALLSHWRKGNSTALIIFTDDWRSETSNNVLAVVKEMLAQEGTPLFVFLTHGNSSVIEALTNGLQDLVKVFDDVFHFAELNAQSREMVLAKPIILQGHRGTLGQVFKGPVSTYLDSSSVVEILGSESDLTLGSELDAGIGYYVDRSLELATVVKPTVFQDGAFRDTVTVRVMLNLGDAKRATKEVSDQQVYVGHSDTVFVEKTVRFLSALFESTCQIKEEAIVNCLVHSPLVVQDTEIAVGPKLPLGSLECNRVALRSVGRDVVTALRVRTIHQAAWGACFLFLSEEIDEHEARKLSSGFNSKHLLSLEDGQLRWMESQGDIGLVRPHIDEAEKEVTKIRPRSVVDVEDRLVLVCAEPGMGKSTLMARLAASSNFPVDFKNYFVILIALNDHCQLFAQNKHKDVLEFLCSANKMEYDQRSNMHRSLLKFALEESGNVFVLFDGYDEIAQRYGEQCCDLVSKILEQTRAKKIWITSRNTFKNQLETAFSKFAFRLCKFDKVDQKSFLKMFWEEKSKQVCKLDEFIDQLLEKTSQAVRDKERNLMGIPLQTQMLAEVYEDHLTPGKSLTAKLPDTLDLLVLLEQFVDKKCSIYVQEKFKIEESKVANYEELYDILKSVFVYRHMKAALGLILDDDVIKSLHMESIMQESSKFFKKIEHGKDKTGFIDSIVNGKPRFIHRVFAEYFLAKWISEHIAGNADLIKSKMFTEEFTVVRNVFDRILAKDCILHSAVLKEDLDQVRTLVEREDVHVKDGGGRTALHLAASFGTSENLEENSRRGEILGLLIGKTRDFLQVDDVLRSSPLQYADLTKSWIALDKFLSVTSSKELFSLTSTDVTNPFMLDTIFNFDLHELLSFCIDKGLPIEYRSTGKQRLLLRACEKGCLKTASLLIERNANINIDDIKEEDNIKMEVERRTALHVTSEHGRIEITKLLLSKYISTSATVAETPLASEYINVKDENGKTAIHKAAKNGHMDLISILIDSDGDIRSLSSNNSSPLHLAAQYKHPGVVKILLEALDEADRAALVNQCDKDGDSVLSCAAWGGCVECVKLIIAAGGTISQNGLAYPTARTSIAKYTTPLHRAAFKRNPEALEVLLESVDEVERAVAANRCDHDGDSVLSCAAWGGCLECIRLVIKAGGRLSPGDIHQEKLLGQENSGSPLKNTGSETDSVNGKPTQNPVLVKRTTPFHRAAQKKHREVLSLLLEPLDEVARTAALNAMDEDGDNVLYNAAWGGCVECVKLALQHGGRMTPSIDTPLMAAAVKGNHEAASYLLANFNPQIECMTKLDFINLRDNRDRSAIFLAAKNGFTSIVSLLIREGGDPQHRDKHNSLPLHLAAENGFPLVVRVLLETLDEADRGAAVNSCDLDGDSALMCAALGGNVECVLLLIEAGGTMASFERDGERLLIAMASRSRPILNFLLGYYNAEHESVNDVFSDVSGYLEKLAEEKSRAVSKTGSNILHRLAGNCHSGSLKVLLDSRVETERVIAVNACDEDGDSVLICAARGGCVDCVEMVVKAGARFCQVNKKGRTALMTASVKNRVEVIRFLLGVFGREREGVCKAGYISMRDEDGRSAFDLGGFKCRDLLESCRARLAKEE